MCLFLQFLRQKNGIIFLHIKKEYLHILYMREIERK